MEGVPTIQPKVNNTMTQLSLFEQFNVDNRTQIEQLKAQLEGLELKASVQDIAITRWKTVLTNAEEALKDLASVFEDAEVLDNAKGDIAQLVDRIMANHDEYFMTPRISSKTVRDEQKTTAQVIAMPLFDEPLPSPTDAVTILTAKQIELILSELSNEQLTDFATKNGINSQRLGTIAKNLANRNLTYVSLTTLINLVRPLLSA